MTTRTVARLLLLGLLAGCHSGTPTAQHVRQTERSVPEEPIHPVGLHNVLRLSDKLYSGSAPEGEEGFRSLSRLGVRTVISVDGSRPDVEIAHRFGLRYVHLPVGYDGIARDRVLQIAKAVRDLPGPVYVHCHHGQHRGPAAAVAAHLCLDERCTVERAKAFLKQAGTDPHYAGLVGLPQALVRPTPEELDGVKSDFPEVATVSNLARCMVEIDNRFEGLKLIRKAGWRQPSDHPDLDPPHEALQLTEQFREAVRLELPARPEELRQWLKAADGQAAELERLLRVVNERGQADHQAVETAFMGVRAACTKCHAKYRDVPR